ncbi:MAG TPA: hypothetical protein PKE38_16960, partial [Ignavibacteriaceae bacterium]|nr:hypothetical protein [Ignavibacteriaceae bacterium]
MIEFKVNVEENLPYDRKSYLSLFNWYGVSFQLPGVFEGESVSLNIYKSAYEQWFKNLISIYDNGLPWIINHDFTDEAWFPNNEHNLLSLRKVFKKNNISNTFVGALVLAKEDLLELTEDIITYPFSVFNKNSILYDN